MKYIYIYFTKWFWPQINTLQDMYLHQLVTDVSKYELLHFRDVLYSLISEVIRFPQFIISSSLWPYIASLLTGNKLRRT